MMSRRLFGCLLILLQTLSACGPPVPSGSTAMAPHPTSSTGTPPADRTWMPTWSPSITMNATEAGNATATEFVMEATDQAQQLINQSAQETATFRWSQFSIPCENPFDWSTSPDGDWLAVLCYSHKYDLLVTNRSGTVYEVPQTDFFNDAEMELGINLFLHSWSTDSRYVYFFMEVCCRDAVGDYLPFSGMQPIPYSLYRLDTHTGITTRFLPAQNELSFSPTGRSLLYINRRGNHCESQACWLEISVLDMETGDLSQYSLDGYLAAGHVVWTEDGLTAYFSAVQNPSVFPDAPQPAWYSYDYSIYTIKMKDSSITEFIRFDESWSIVYPIDLTPNCLMLQSDTYDSTLNLMTLIHCLDLQTHSISPPLPAPAP